jgi:hypothetical protein
MRCKECDLYSGECVIQDDTASTRKDMEEHGNRQAANSNCKNSPFRKGLEY